MSAAGIQPTASVLSSTIKHLGVNLRIHPLPPPTRLKSALKLPYYPNKLSDCPFCQRVLLMLEEKHLRYDLKLVDLNKKPGWFLKINEEGTVPVIKLDEKWVPDSEIIPQSLEEKFPNPPLRTPPERLQCLFYCFIGICIPI